MTQMNKTEEVANAAIAGSKEYILNGLVNIHL